MQLIYLRGGNVAKPKFDTSLLEPIEENNESFESKLKPADEDEEDEGAYLDTLPQPESHPFRDIGIGLVHAGRNLHNLPHDLAEGVDTLGSSIGRLFGAPEFKNKNSNIASHFPNDTQDYSDVFGGNKDNDTMIDKLIKGGVEHAPEIIGAGGLLRGGFRRLKGTHQLDEASRLINQKGLNEFNYPKEMIKEAKKFLPQSQATKELLKRVKGGNYDAAMKLQSQVGHHQRALAKSPLASENSIMAPQAGDLKQSMLGHLENVLRATNNHEEADLMRKGINNYKTYMKVKEKLLPAMKYFGIPTTALAALGFGYRKLKQGLSD